MAASLASVPELQKKAWPPKLRSERSLGPAALHFGVPGVGHVDQRGDLLLDGFDDGAADNGRAELQPQPGKKSR